MSKISQNYSADTLKFIHITDTHLLNRPDETFYNLNTQKNLESVLSLSKARYPDIDFFIFTGDISQTGTKESYTLFKSLTQQYELPIYCVPGNHDTPYLLQSIIPSCPNSSINIIQLGSFSLILLNSCVEDKHHGLINDLCLRQLEDYLKNNENQFNIIAIHHPPVLINSKWLDDLGLQNQTEFLHIINKFPHNTLLICGHVHQEIDQQSNNLRLLATPSTCHQFKTNSDYRHHIETPSPAYRYIKITTDKVETKVHYVK